MHDFNSPIVYSHAYFCLEQLRRVYHSYIETNPPTPMNAAQNKKPNVSAYFLSSKLNFLVTGGTDSLCMPSSVKRLARLTLRLGISLSRSVFGRFKLDLLLKPSDPGAPGTSNGLRSGGLIGAVVGEFGDKPVEVCGLT